MVVGAARLDWDRLQIGKGVKEAGAGRSFAIKGKKEEGKPEQAAAQESVDGLMREKLYIKGIQLNYLPFTAQFLTKNGRIIPKQLMFL